MNIAVIQLPSPEPARSAQPSVRPVSRGCVGALLVAACVWTTPASATTALILPVDGPGLLPSLRDDLEGGIRASLQARPQSASTPRRGKKAASLYELTSSDDTAAVLQDAVGAGLACSLEDVDCVVRIGVIAGVDEVWAPIALQDSTVLQLRVTRVDVAARRAQAIAAGVVVHPAQDDGLTIARILDRLLAPTSTLEVTGPAGAQVRVGGAVVGVLPLRAPVAVEAGLREVQALLGGRILARKTIGVVEGHQQLDLTVAAPVVVATEPEPEQPEPDPLVMAGGASVGIGALLALGAGVGVVVVETGLATPKPGRDDPLLVKEQRDLGTLLVVGTVTGLAVAVAGSVLLGMGMAQ